MTNSLSKPTWTAQSANLQPLTSVQTADSALRPAGRKLGRRAGMPTIASLEQSVLQQINQYRQQRGLPALRSNSTIAQQSRQHSQNMANSGVLSHNGFSGRVSTIGRTIRYRSAAENVAFNSGFSNPVAQAVNGWLNSPGHLQNIVGNFNLTGIGVARNSRGAYYFTQIFIRS
jgi:uncharacterized protein YkwD